MKLVVDANVLFSALITRGITAELLFDDELRLFAPEFLFEEFSLHEKEVLEKTHRTPEEFRHLCGILRRRISVVPVAELLPWLDEARRITPDEKDSAYFATAMALGRRAALWSNDSHLKEQKRISVISTEELVRILRGKKTSTS